MPYTDCWVIFAISLSSALVAEGISWVLIYRTKEYKDLKAKIEALGNKVEKKREMVTNIAKQKSKNKKVDQLEEQLKSKNKEMAMVKFKATAFVMMTLMAVFAILNNLFDGRVVAKLPFVPFPLMRSMTHRNLPGNDHTDCAMIFVYVVSSFAVRQNVQKFFGFAPKTAAAASSMFAPPKTAYGNHYD